MESILPLISLNVSEYHAHPTLSTPALSTLRSFFWSLGRAAELQNYSDAEAHEEFKIGRSGYSQLTVQQPGRRTPLSES